MQPKYLLCRHSGQIPAYSNERGAPVLRALKAARMFREYDFFSSEVQIHAEYAFRDSHDMASPASCPMTAILSYSSLEV